MAKEISSGFPDIENENYPLDVREENYQSETGVKKGFNIEDQKMPTITHEVQGGGKEGSAPSQSGKPLRGDYDPKNDPDSNLHEQFVDAGAFKHSPGAFNR